MNLENSTPSTSFLPPPPPLHSPYIKNKTPQAMEFESDANRKRLHPSTDEDQEPNSKNASSSLPSKQSHKKRHTTSSTSKDPPKTPSKENRLQSEFDPLSIPIHSDRHFLTPSNYEKDKYDAFSKAPYFVHFRFTNIQKDNKKNIPLVKVAKILTSINIKPIQVQKYSYNTWRAYFSSKNLANASTNNKYLAQVNLKAFIPRYKLSRKFVLKEIPEDMALDDVKGLIEDENPNVLITNLFRLKRRDRATNKLIDSMSVCFESRGENIPDHILILRTVNPTFAYIPRVRFCYQCGKIGHTSRFCEKDVTCLNCSENHAYSKENPCKKDSRCVNCDGKHHTLNRSCPAFIRQSSIIKIMAIDNLPFLEALQIYNKNTNTNSKSNNTQPPPLKSLRNFPLLTKLSDDSTLPTPSKSTPLSKHIPPNKDSSWEQLLRLMESAINSPNIEKLIERLSRTIDLHRNNAV